MICNVMTHSNNMYHKGTENGFINDAKSEEKSSTAYWTLLK